VISNGSGRSTRDQLEYPLRARLQPPSLVRSDINPQTKNMNKTHARLFVLSSLVVGLVSCGGGGGGSSDNAAAPAPCPPPSPGIVRICGESITLDVSQEPVITGWTGSANIAQVAAVESTVDEYVRVTGFRPDQRFTVQLTLNRQPTRDVVVTFGEQPAAALGAQETYVAHAYIRQPDDGGGAWLYQLPTGHVEATRVLTTRVPPEFFVATGTNGQSFSVSLRLMIASTDGAGSSVSQVTPQSTLYVIPVPAGGFVPCPLADTGCTEVSQRLPLRQRSVSETPHPHMGTDFRAPVGTLVLIPPGARVLGGCGESRAAAGSCGGGDAVGSGRSGGRGAYLVVELLTPGTTGATRVHYLHLSRIGSWAYRRDAQGRITDEIATFQDRVTAPDEAIQRGNPTLSGDTGTWRRTGTPVASPHLHVEVEAWDGQAAACFSRASGGTVCRRTLRAVDPFFAMVRWLEIRDDAAPAGVFSTFMDAPALARLVGYDAGNGGTTPDPAVSRTVVSDVPADSGEPRRPVCFWDVNNSTTVSGGSAAPAVPITVGAEALRGAEAGFCVPWPSERSPVNVTVATNAERQLRAVMGRPQLRAPLSSTQAFVLDGPVAGAHVAAIVKPPIRPIWTLFNLPYDARTGTTLDGDSSVSTSVDITRSIPITGLPSLVYRSSGRSGYSYQTSQQRVAFGPDTGVNVFVQGAVQDTGLDIRSGSLRIDGVSRRVDWLRGIDNVAASCTRAGGTARDGVLYVSSNQEVLFVERGQSTPVSQVVFTNGSALTTSEGWSVTGGGFGTLPEPLLGFSWSAARDSRVSLFSLSAPGWDCNGVSTLRPMAQ
jgi:hypothetical protein